MVTITLAHELDAKHPRPWIGIECVSPAIVAKLDANLDPQHGFGKGGVDGTLFADHEHDAYGVITAATVAAFYKGTEAGTLVIERPDLDALTAAAFLAGFWDRLYGAPELDDEQFSVKLDEILPRVTQVGQADAFCVTKWAPRPLPTPENPWCSHGPVEDRAGLAALNAACMDRNVPIEQRVETVAHWLLKGDLPPVYNEQVYATRLKAIASLKDHPPVVEGSCVLVESMHPGAIGIGYCLAPVVVAYNAAFRHPNGLVAPKYTVAAIGDGYCDFAGLRQALTNAEPGHFPGGPKNLVASDMSKGTALLPMEVFNLVQKSC